MAPTPREPQPVDLPEAFAVALTLVEGRDATTRARILTEALNAVPGLQAWLRYQRQLAVRDLKAQDMNDAQIAPLLKVSTQRVADIASGHGTRKAPRPKPEPTA
ncbi:sigma-70 family RNA polymerase sigma factor [Embleya sp. AB8]|uniref:sigma-70 family RNA polymerase sigma factor n=1 Tax=Embleya sp. AB8 TaxID=3156304 RepID=UPI003C754090